MTEEVNFDQLNLKISDFTKSYPIDIQKEIFEYLSELDDIHRKGYQIAYDHLGTSFNITRSNGFKSWQNKKKSN